MTVDNDYDTNWNKENVPPGGVRKKAVSFERLASKRNVLGELPEFLEDENDTITDCDWQPLSVSAPTEYSIETQKRKWAQIAAALCCDAEDDEEALMEELLQLCSWYDDCEKPIPSSMHERFCYLNTPEFPDDDDEIETFYAHLRSQKIYFGSPRDSDATIRPEDLHLSSLRLQSRLSAFGSPPSISGGSSGIVSSIKADAMCPLGSSEIVLPSKDSASLPSSVPDNLSFASQKTFLRTPTMRENCVNSKDDLIEQAFLGVTNEDNDVVMKWRSSESRRSAAPFHKLECESNSSFWADVDFGI